MSVDVNELKPDARVRLPGRTDAVTLVAVKPGPFYEFVFIGPDGPGQSCSRPDPRSPLIPASCGCHPSAAAANKKHRKKKK